MAVGGFSAAGAGGCYLRRITFVGDAVVTTAAAGRRRLKAASGLRRLLGLHLALDLQGAGRQRLVLGLQQEAVETAAEVEGAQGGVRDPQPES